MAIRPHSSPLTVKGEGTPILFLHSSLASKSQWEKASHVLCREYQTIACDLQGYGARKSVDKVSEHFRLDDEIETIKEMLTFSDYFKKWTVRFGYIGLVVSFISIVAGIFLFFPKQFTLKLLYFSLGLSIVVAIAQYIIMSNDDGSGVITMFSGIGSIMVGVFNVIILLIVIANDKTVFYPMEDDY